MIFFKSILIVLSISLYFSVDDFSLKTHDYSRKKVNSDSQFVYTFVSKIDCTTQVQSLVYLPDGYNKDRASTYPLLIFLHGNSETGNDIQKVKSNGPPKLIEGGKSFPFIVVSPQLSRKLTSDWDPELVDEIFENIKRNFRIDESRFYMTGVSVGGAGVWKYAIKFPQKVSAVAPIAAWGDPPKACKMKNVPSWTFHGARDRVINVNSSKNMVNALLICGASAKYTEYANAGHDAWTKTYANDDLYKWFLSHSKKAVEVNRSSPASKPKSINKLDSEQAPGKNPYQLNKKKLASLPISLKESSGLVASNSNSFWTHNDSGNSPVLFNIDSTGKIKTIKKITNASNFDWEDLTHDSNNNFYIGDFGNNKGLRKSLQIFKIPNPESVQDERIKAEKIEFTFEDQHSYPPPVSELNFDVEAMIFFKESIYLFTKNNSKPYNGFCKMYRIPAQPGSYIAELRDSIQLGNSMLEASITGAALTADNKHLLLLSYTKIFVFSCFPNDDFFKGSLQEWNFPFISQKEAISVLENNKVFLTDEVFHGVGGTLYELSTPIFKSNSCY